ncbi:2-C-methyl-D-erythritol 2,4-cyclodiphosphate synthase [Spirochaeta thermophila]|uniref:2-C-methyl-D-erythritol 2,4-cyclodiphosphate synthase n=1 Tax=Winmispira thermophila (strain ATCC 49972 / DSM 6192 / RI 19.B1) TaxID=665571 RepID=E0RPY1_WINT6|nr:2-C-methyl-D-erythritol 2,4-cyclodiphosphate synthase [Spirochaeta thermophila]ADN02834.1 2-C-methyl-D-erythritol 2,4-cyclodiphosphate synthase [Spirochaeta thermophila DSM 6192]
MRIGMGYDSHRLKKGRPLVLGGVQIPSPRGEAGHSDGDVLLHAITDAIYGALAEGDIGTHFPPSDPRHKDKPSRFFLSHALDLMESRGLRIVNLDCTVILERPRLAPHREAIRASLSALLSLPPDAVSIKAKTKEGLDAAGRGKAIEAFAVLLLEARV